MTQQQLLQCARDVLVPTTAREKANRKTLQVAARQTGRSAEAVAKASTMRLAMWVTKGTSAI